MRRLVLIANRLPTAGPFDRYAQPLVAPDFVAPPATESADPIYLDPPFNSDATYNVSCWGKADVVGCVAEPLLPSRGC